MDSRPNVVLLHCHDLGQYLGCYGVDVETPNVDRLAAEGARFANHFTAAPQCSPSRGSLHTGLYPHQHGLMGLAHTDWELDVRRTLPYRLSELGYETHQFGLQHVSEEPERLGYDEIHTAGTLSPEVSPAVHSANRARDVAETVATYLTNGLESPFFASIGFFEAHRVLEDDGGDDPLYGFGDRYDTPDPEAVEVPGYLPDEPGVREDLADLQGMVRALDDGVGTVLDALAAAGIDDETLVVFTTEHGVAFPRAKGTCYDPGIEGVLLSRYPPLIDPGTVYEGLVSNVDVLPTIIDAVADEIPDYVEGRSLVPLFDDRPFAERDAAFAELTWHGTYNPVRAIRTDRYKYVRHFWHGPRVFMPDDVFASRAGRAVRGRYGLTSDVSEELYDLEADPWERENVAADEAYDQVREELAKRLGGWLRETSDPILDGPIPPADYDELFAGLE